MALGSDRIQVQKQESTDGGGTFESALPAGIRELQDAISSSGWYIQDGGETQVSPDELVALLRDGSGELRGFDQVHGGPAATLSVFGLTWGLLYSANSITTTEETNQDAFAGDTPDEITVPADGTYWCFLRCDLRTTNASGQAFYGVSVNDVNIVNDGRARISGNFWQAGFAFVRIAGLTTSDTIKAAYRRNGSVGTVQMRRRTLFALRVGA